MTLPIIVPDNFRIIAHRGASAYAPENTKAAFKLAADMNTQEFEIDAQLSSDGRVVLCHELTLEKYGHGNIVVEETPWDELRQLDMGSWFSPFLFHNEKMVTLDELFNEYKNRVVFHIEIKGRAVTLSEKVCNITQDYDLLSSCIVTSFSFDALFSIQTMQPKLQLGWLVNDITPEVLSTTRKSKLFQICPAADNVSRDKVDLAHGIVPQVRAWGVDGKPQEVLSLIKQVIDSNCDGMTINWPDWLIHKRHI